MVDRTAPVDYDGGMKKTIDWTRKVREIRASGMTLAEIASEAGITIPSVWDISKGRTDRVLYETGAAILRLHRRAAVQAALRRVR